MSSLLLCRWYLRQTLDLSGHSGATTLSVYYVALSRGHLKRHGAGLLLREVAHAVVSRLHLVEHPQAGRLGIQVPLQGPQVLLITLH